MDNKEKPNGINWKHVLIAASIAAVISSGISVGAAYAMSTVNFPKFTVTFKNDDDSILQKSVYRLGEVPVYKQATPTKPDSKKEQYYDYTFNGWDKELGSVITDVTYTATYTATHQVYDVIYYDEDGTTVLEEKKVNRGEEATYTKDIPTKPSDSTFQYKFVGWSKQGSQEEGKVIYKATYSNAMVGLVFDENDPSTVIGYTGSETCVKIPESFGGVTIKAIGSYAFSPKEEGTSAITEIQLPNTIETIATGAFSGCNALTNIKLPTNEKYQTIENYLFYNCGQLSKIDIPDNVLEIKENVFGKCTNLKNIKLGKGVAKIGDDFFTETSAIETIEVDEENQVFKNDDSKTLILSKDGNVLIRCLPSANSVTIPNDVHIITNFAFNNCSKLTKIELNGVIKVDEGAFKGCTGITEFNTGNTASLSANIFKDNTSLETVVIGPGMKAYDKETGEGLSPAAFAECKNLKSFSVSEENENFSAQDGYLCNAAGDQLLRCPTGVTTAPTIAETITTIGENAFQNCTFDSISIPETVTTIKSFAFKDCPNLTDLEYGDGVTSIGEGVASGTKLKSVTLGKKIAPLGIDSKALSGCTTLEEIHVVDGNENGLVDVDGILCLQVQKVTVAIIRCPYKYQKFTNNEYTVPNTVYALSDFAFSDVTTLNKITLHDNIKAIGKRALTSSSLQTLKVNTGSFVEKCTFDENAFLECKINKIEFASVSGSTSGIITSFASKMGVNTLGVSLLSSDTSIGGFNDNKNIDEITLKDEVTEITKDAFKNCTELKTINITSGSKITKIGISAFECCRSLTTIPYMPELTAIDDRAFFDCRFTSLDLSSFTKLTEIGVTEDSTTSTHGAFRSCPLTSIKLSSSIKTIGRNTFSDITTLSEINFVEGLTSIGSYCFTNCQVSKIELPASLVDGGVNALGAGAFTGCTALVDVKFNGTKAQWESIYNKSKNVFQNCHKNLTKVYGFDNGVRWESDIN